MVAEPTNQEFDSIYKQGLLKYEPWQIALTSVVSGAALMGMLLAFLNWIHPATPPQPMFPPGTVITIPAAPAK